MVTVKTPTTAKTYFSFGKRLNFVPKGLSPALKEHKEVDVSLSQNAKDKLQNMILEGYGDEDMLIKWQNYISNGKYFNMLLTYGLLPSNTFRSKNIF